MSNVKVIRTSFEFARTNSQGRILRTNSQGKKSGGKFPWGRIPVGQISGGQCPLGRISVGHDGNSSQEFVLPENRSRNLSSGDSSSGNSSQEFVPGIVLWELIPGIRSRNLSPQEFVLLAIRPSNSSFQKFVLPATRRRGTRPHQH